METNASPLAEEVEVVIMEKLDSQEDREQKVSPD